MNIASLTTKSSLSLSCSFLSQSPKYVIAIHIVTKRGRLKTLAMDSEDLGQREIRREVKEAGEENNANSSHTISKNNQYVSNIQFGSDKSIKSYNQIILKSKEEEDVNNNSTKSYDGSQTLSKNNQYVSNIRFVTDTISKSYIPNKSKARQSPPAILGSKQEKFSNRSKLSGYILDGGDSFHIAEDAMGGTAATNNDMEEVTNFTRTISRKRIINRIRNANYGLEDLDNDKKLQYVNDAPKQREFAPVPAQPTPNHPPPGRRPLSKILERLHSVHLTENAYVSITDSLYQSLQNNTKPADDNNNDTNKIPSVCPVLVANILATHAETFRHAMMTRCVDCHDYADSLKDALPYLEPRLFTKNPMRGGHGNISSHGVLPLSDVEKGMFEKSREQNMNELESRKHGRTICYLAAAILSILVLISVIVVLTMMVAIKEMRF